MKIYVDMDGVICAFQEKLSEILGKPAPKEFGNDPKIWGAITKAGKDFWSSMKWLPDGHELWDGVKEYNPIILSAPTNHESSVEGKKEWLKENLPNVPFIIEQKKEKYATKDSVLIDDREKNIKKWEEAGGIGILHKDADTTLNKLKDVMKHNKKEAAGIPPIAPKKPWIPKGIRGGRPEKPIPPKKGGPYVRDTKWEKEVKASFIACKKLRKIANLILS